MKRLFLYILLTITLQANCTERLDSLLHALDYAIANSEIYTARKHAKIARLRQQMNRCNGDHNQLYEINRLLYEEYRAFRFDSAVFYLSECIEYAAALGDIQKKTQSKLRLSYLYSSTGRYESAIDILHSVERGSVSGSLLADYYACYDHCYGEMVSYDIGGKELRPYYERMMHSYKDSLYAAIDKGSVDFLKLEETKYRDAKMTSAALRINDMQLARLTPDSADYAVTTYYRALTYGVARDTISQMEYFALSALTDIRLAKKDHASLWMLANLLLRRGDIERANNYMRFSWNDTNFYNSPLRYWQSSNVQKIIDGQFQNLIITRNKTLVTVVIVISALAVLLLLAMLQIIRQKRRLTVAQANLQEINGKLNDLNTELSRINADLKLVNTNLEESNCIKEVYISRFVKLCSEYIDKLEKYRVTIQKSLSLGKIDDVKKLAKSSSLLNNEVKVLYQNFDTAFLHIFPDFVAKFNALLQDDEQIALKPDELLNTELRIFALIRLGFNDSSQIAEILRYSVNTIYNYRAKVKNKAKGNRADFEELVRNIR